MLSTFRRRLGGLRRYHSYPDPSEKPVITTSIHKKDAVVSSKKDDISLDKKFKIDSIFPGVPVTRGIKPGEKAPETRSTVLKNGITVATQEVPGSLMSSITFMLGSGSANETQDNSKDSNKGLTHILELTAFKSTKSRSHTEYLANIEKLGAMCQCLSSRESVMYCVDVFRDNIEKAVDLLAEAVIHPALTPEEINESKEVVLLQQNELPAEILSRDAVQLAAFQGHPLGNRHYCPSEALEKISSESLVNYRNKFLFGENSIIAAAGVDHDEFVALIQSKFASIPSRGDNGAKAIKKNKSIFTGGIMKNERALKEPFVKVAIAFEAVGWRDENLVATCVLQMLLGGGSSFSAGGPGKGMYTRLYRTVLNQYHWVESAESFLSIHEDKGLIGIDGACTPEHVIPLMQVLLQHLMILEFELVSDEELSRAKNMLKSMMMMQLESRLVTCEDIARQYLTFGMRESSLSICDKIDKITAVDIQKVAKIMFQNGIKPAIGCVGHDLSTIPPYENVKAYAEQVRGHFLKTYQGQNATII